MRHDGILAIEFEILTRLFWLRRSQREALWVSGNLRVSCGMRHDGILATEFEILNRLFWLERSQRRALEVSVSELNLGYDLL